MKPEQTLEAYNLNLGLLLNKMKKLQFTFAKTVRDVTSEIQQSKCDEIRTMKLENTQNLFYIYIYV